MAPQFKFNNLFNKHFPLLFFKIFCLVKTCEVEVDCYSKFGLTDGNYSNDAMALSLDEGQRLQLLGQKP